MQNPIDTSITTYRCHAHALLHGKLSPKSIMAELTGRIGGASKGKGGSMHLYSKENGFFGGLGIVGTTVPIGAGLALKHKYTNDGGVSVAYLGDGAMAQGQLYEAINMAALWNLPLVVVIENNQYSMGTSLSRTHSNTNLSKHGEPFNIVGEIVDGMNILDVLEKGKKAIEYARSGKGVYLLDVQTYRYRGHSMSDPQKYRSKDEVSSKKEEDPIEQFEKYGIDNKLFTKDDIDATNKTIKVSMRELEEEILQLPEADIEELYTDVYMD